MGGPWVPQPITTTSSVLLWVALLCLAPAIRSDGPARAVVTLEPPWFNVLQGDVVTLTCHGFQTPGQDSIEWLHNGLALPIYQESFTIPAVNMKDSGEYQCRTEHTALSNSVQLQVSTDWLLLQAERLEFIEGDTMILRCHSMKSKPLHKVTYYHNDIALKYGFRSFDYIVSQVNHAHSGSYSCTGVMEHVSLVSAPVFITVKGPARAVVTLEPPWFNVLREDNVTLTCHGFQTPGKDSIEWLHNGLALPIYQDSFTIPAINLEDSGEYQCRTEHTAFSNSVQLQVSTDWLLLQAERLEFMKGDTMILRCHSWRSKPLQKVTYYHNDIALKYDFQSFNYIVSQVNHTHSGSYSCIGVMGHASHISAPVFITVKVPNTVSDP
ncbi:low affinity immunoglobulin gamma Fc region receptor II-b-like [Trichosurus vulpecula]|uniref:low affinity immunoglobulin gamma Fc region receptor II-b-like n=1 Tax=Trichosurus vulpecula TaxID=9337 RepID=UPI00186B0CBE|nr:low affinity immunoglobulin gamma Fc region receptor II-b-like [Trichosurus vulpecula]